MFTDRTGKNSLVSWAGHVLHKVALSDNNSSACVARGNELSAQFAGRNRFLSLFFPATISKIFIHAFIIGKIYEKGTSPCKANTPRLLFLLSILLGRYPFLQASLKLPKSLAAQSVCLPFVFY